jgi:thiol-disulfide isomerase/thioredoxin
MTKKVIFSLALLLSLIAGVAFGYRQLGGEASSSSNSESSSAVDIGGQRFIRWDSPRELPALPIKNEQGQALTLSDFQGRVVLLNIWATWCPPCREEMPSLDRLNAKRGGESFEVVALSIDSDPSLVMPFYREIGVKTLRGYFDPTTRALTALGAFAVPTTLLIDQQGREVGRSLGPAEWDSPEVEALIDTVLTPPSAKN